MGSKHTQAPVCYPCALAAEHGAIMCEGCEGQVTHECVWCGSLDTRLLSRGTESDQYRCDECDRFFRVIEL